jgi:cytochrome b561
MSKNNVEHGDRKHDACALHAGYVRLRARKHTPAPAPVHPYPQAHTHARTHTHTHKYVIPIAFPKQQWFCERASLLRLKYVGFIFFLITTLRMFL